MSWNEHRFAPEAGTELCPLADLPEREGREFHFGESKWPFRMFVVRRGRELRGYVNVCPHLHINLNYFPDRFVSHDREFILCANHGALFDFENGYCVSGPCTGESLDTVPLEVRDGKVCIA